MGPGKSGDERGLAPALMARPRARAFRIVGEVLLPLVRDLDGPQLETDPTFVPGLRIVAVSY